MKRTKKIALIIATLMLMAVCFVFGVSAQTINYADYIDMGLVNPDTQTMLSFDFNGGSMKDSAYVFDTTINEFVLTEGEDITGIYVMLPMEPDAQTEGQYIILPNATAPNGYKLNGWYCYNDGIIYAPATAYCIPQNTAGKVIQFFAYYVQDKGYYEEPFYYRVADEKATIVEVESSFEGKLVIPDTLGGYEVTAIKRGVFSNSIITEFSVSEENKYFSVDEFGVLFNKDKTELIAYPVANTQTSYKIPDSVEVIGSCAVANAFFLKNLELPKNLRTIKEGGIISAWFLDEIYLSDKVEKLEDAAVYDMPFLRKIYVEGMNTEFGENRAVGFIETYFKDEVEKDYCADLWAKYLQGDESVVEELSSYLEYPAESYYKATMYCHSGSTAEAYAIANGMDYELIHFFKGEWTYDYDNMIRTRQCIHCDVLETEPLESTGTGDVEIIEPIDPDTDFEVDEIEKNGDKYILVEDCFKHHHHGHWDVVKVFDITMKNKDGVHVQPDGTVKVKLPHDWKHENYKVYRVNDDGTLTDMNAYREGSHIVFETDHFSIYVIVDESEKSEQETPAEPGTSDCGCICHKTGSFLNFINTLFRFLIKLLGVFPTCDCGLAHY